MIGMGISAANAEVMRQPVAAGEDQFAAMTEAYSNMTLGKIGVINAVFAANCSYTIKFYNAAGGAQIGTTKTGTYTGTPVSPPGVTCADGITVIAKYTCTTSAPGFKNVTAETVIWTKVMIDGSGALGPDTPDTPAA
jgi:hypothetical protein